MPDGADSRAPAIGYPGQVARSAEQLGYEAVLTPAGTWCEDARAFTAALSPVTRRLKFPVAFRPGFVHLRRGAPFVAVTPPAAECQ